MLKQSSTPAHDRDVTVPTAIDVEIPVRIEHQAHACLAVLTRKRREIHVIAEDYVHNLPLPVGCRTV
jgi:hypothetical protein